MCKSNTEHVSNLIDIPDIDGTNIIFDIYDLIGVVYKREKGNVSIDPSKINCSNIPVLLSNKIRPSYYFVGALLNRFKEVTIGYPGGDKIGKRPIDQHIKAFRALGATVEKKEAYYVIIVIKGVSRLNGVEHKVIPDRIIAGTFLIQSGLSNTPIKIQNVIPEHLQAVLYKLNECNITTIVEADSITSYAQGNLRPITITTGMYPEFPSDFKQPMTALLTQAQGQSIIIEKVYTKRFQHCDELNKMGANISTNSNGLAVIYGPTELKGTWVSANDIRAGVCLIIAGSISEGITFIDSAEQITRGYQDVIRMFTSIGCIMEYHHTERDINEITDYESVV